MKKEQEKKTGVLRKRVKDDKETKEVIDEKPTDKNKEKGALKLRKR